MAKQLRNFPNATAAVGKTVRLILEASSEANLAAEVGQIKGLPFLTITSEIGALLIIDVAERRDGLEVVIYHDGLRLLPFQLTSELLKREVQHVYRRVTPNVPHMWWLFGGYDEVTEAQAEAAFADMAARRKTERDVMRLLKRGLDIDQVCEVLRLTRIYDVLEERIVEFFVSRYKYTIADVRAFAARTYRRRDAVVPQVKVSAISQRTRALRASGLRVSYARSR